MGTHDHPAPVVSASGTLTRDGVRVPEFAKDTMLVIPETFETFGCRVPTTSPPTPDRVTPDVTINREFYGSLDLVMPDGRKVRIWGFEDPTSSVRQPFPSAPIRVREGQVIHTHVKVKKGAHTIHHHGIEPTAFNDGVGHTSFEVDSDYTYQWKADLGRHVLLPLPREHGPALRDGDVRPPDHRSAIRPRYRVRGRTGIRRRGVLGR